MKICGGRFDVGEHVTVIHNREARHARVDRETINNELALVRVVVDAPEYPWEGDAILELEHEGVQWERGWTDGIDLLAKYLLVRSSEGGPWLRN